MADTTPHLDLATLPEYFRGLIREALDHRKAGRAPQTPEAVEFYLVNLLQGCLSTEAVYPSPPENFPKNFKEEPLALLYLKAAQSRDDVRVALLRRLGDFSLFISGFFPMSLGRRLVDVDYYIQMGETAYGNLSQIVARRAALSEIFTELARRFVMYVDILAEVSERSRLQNHTDILRLYEHWLKTGSERTAKLLSDAGILPVKAPRSAH